MDPAENQTKPQEGPSRRRWWQRRPKAPPDPSIVQVMAQWAEYELIFNDILGRLSAHLARQAKMEKKRLARLSQDALEGGLAPADAAETNGPPLAPQSAKAALRSQYATQRFGGRIEALIQAREATSERRNKGGETL